MTEQSLVVQKKKTVLENIIDIFLIFIVIISIIIATLSGIIIIKESISPYEVPDIMGIKPFIVLTGSMEPIIKAGDLVLVKEVNENELKINDIIAFRYTKEDEALIHRIVGIEEYEGKTFFTTKGDNNQTEDKLNIEYKNIEGIYSFRIGKIGEIAMFIRTKQGIAISLLAITTIFFLWQFVKSLKREKIAKRRLKECREVIEELKKGEI